MPDGVREILPWSDIIESDCKHESSIPASAFSSLFFLHVV